MANVKQYTDQIAKAQKGREVRDSIVKAINAVSEENNSYGIQQAEAMVARLEAAITEAKRTGGVTIADLEELTEATSAKFNSITQKFELADDEINSTLSAVSESVAKKVDSTTYNSEIAQIKTLIDKATKYQKGDVVTGTCNTGGFLTATNKAVLFIIPLDKIIDTSKVTVTVTSLKMCVRQNGYLVGSADSQVESKTAITTQSVEPGGLRLTVQYAASIGGTNNDAVGVSANYKISFS